MAFGRLGEICGQYLHKGKQVYIEGRIQTRKWQDKEGHDRYTTEIVARELQMLGRRDEMEASSGGASGGFGGGTNNEGFNPPAMDSGGGATEDDDLPF